MMTALELKDITRNFKQGGRTLEVLRHVTVSLKAGELVGLYGQSGAGKSTLLHIAGLLEAPTSGEVVIDGTACRALGDRERTAIRRNKIGFVYQFHHLLPEFTALENVAMPLWIDGGNRKQTVGRADELLTRLGLGERLDHLPAQLSGGEQQRVAIARALANKPLLVLADEPTGNLDEKTASAVMDEFVGAVRDSAATCLIATHNPALAERLDRKLVLHDGKIAED